MNAAELRGILASEEAIEQNPFKYLREISSFVNDPDEEEVGRDLVLRALERSASFSGLEEVLEALTRQVGLFPYMEKSMLRLRDRLAYELHTVPAGEHEIVFHRVQAEVFRRLMQGENVILSAPTSFGKSRILDAVLATHRFANVAVIVPTIALIDETRRRLSAFREHYKVVTQIGQTPADRNIFVLTAERFNGFDGVPKIDFFVIDEFYKLGDRGDDNSRMVALNQAFYRLQKGGAQFYLLGPSIQKIPEGLESKFRCFFLSTSFATVASETIRVFDWKDEIQRLVHLCQDIDGQTLIFCKSPKRVNDVVRALVKHKVIATDNLHMSAAEWIAEHVHLDWSFGAGLIGGIGMHHGRLPRSLAQYAVKKFNAGALKFLVCTSTLIEGVNTKAKNVVILDDVINKTKYDFFTFNNIRGRSGRMFQHFVGRVFLFHPPPQAELPFVDMPIFTQDESTPESLLVQLADEDLLPKSKVRLEGVFAQTVLPVEILRQNAGIDPRAQIRLAERLIEFNPASAMIANWSQLPKWNQLLWACEMVWEHLVDRGRSGVFSGKQLAFKTFALMRGDDIPARVNAELGQPDPRFRAGSPDEAVERVFEFDRNWASFELPRLLMALSKIQAAVFMPRFGFAGDYSYFAGRVETLFKTRAICALEEYGIPVQLSDKLSKRVNLGDDIDASLEAIRAMDLSKFELSEFEREVLDDVRSQL
jgi:late competence protein required for DNA uptake (superfamily II DNA/RNA helicase)